MIYITQISTKIDNKELQFTVQYSASDEMEAIEMAQKEWPFPEYYQLSAREIMQEEPCPFGSW